MKRNLRRDAPVAALVRLLHYAGGELGSPGAAGTERILDLARAAAFLTTALMSLLFCLGLGWGPAASPVDPVPLALVGMTATGLLWPAIVLRLIRRRREMEAREA